MLYGKELILDLHSCNTMKFTRASIEQYFIELCDLIDMEREDLHWWDYDGDPEAYANAPEHLKGISAIQFIKTSNITIHTLDDLQRIYINIFSCKEYSLDVALNFSAKWFCGEVNSWSVVPRQQGDKVELIEMKGHHFLWINDYLQMWDILPERNAQRSLAIQAKGDVLVVGYGLGIVQKFLVENPLVNSIKTIELRQEVIDANKRADREIIGDVLIRDFFEYGKNGQKYDCIIGDICDEIMPEYLPKYAHLKAHAVPMLKPHGKVLQWGGEYFEFLLRNNSNEHSYDHSHGHRV